MTQGPTDPSNVLLTPDVWQDSQYSTSLNVTGMLDKESLEENPDLPLSRWTPNREAIVTTRGVMLSTSAFLACHQCYCAGSSLAWGLNLRALVCGIL